MSAREEFVSLLPADFNWKQPNYEPIFAERMRRLNNIRGSAEPVAVWNGLKAFYKDHPVEFITDWGVTFDPRNAEVGIDPLTPFMLFPRQREYVEWLLARWRGREDGLGEKSRDMGVSWLCCAFAVWMWLFYPGSVIGFGSRKEEYVDKLGDPKSLFWKIRKFVDLLPKELQPEKYSEKMHAPSMRIINPENNAAIIGEAGDNIGRGNRTSIYFLDEAAFIERPEAVDAALSQTSNCKIHVSTVNGAGNPFYKKRHSGNIAVFIFDWKQDPRKDEEWYEHQCRSMTPAAVASEIDRNYEASVTDAFIDAIRVNEAIMRDDTQMGSPRKSPLRVGIDVARFGDDKTCIVFRRGRFLVKLVRLQKMDVVNVAGRARAEIAAFGEKPQQIAVDTIGIGAGVADILRGHYPDEYDRDGKRIEIVKDVNSAIRMSNGQHYNLRAYMWDEMKAWMQGASIPNDQDLKTDLTALRYGFRGGELLLESKEDAKRRGVKSPDSGDALALTFAYSTITEPKTGKLLGLEPYRAQDSSMGM